MLKRYRYRTERMREILSQVIRLCEMVGFVLEIQHQQLSLLPVSYTQLILLFQFSLDLAGNWAPGFLSSPGLTPHRRSYLKPVLWIRNDLFRIRIQL